MIYDTKKRRFIFQNKAEVPPSAILFYDLPHLLSPGEDICPEATLLAERLPQWGLASLEYGWDLGALPHQLEAIRWTCGARVRALSHTAWGWVRRSSPSAPV